MGSCFSSATSANPAAISTAKVIALDGSLKEYSAPITVSAVLESAAGAAGPSRCFLCNSDSLYFDSYIPTIDPKSEVQPGHLYFVLSVSKLEQRLSGSDMAALAVMASSALASAAAAAGGKHRKKFRVMPVEEISGGDNGAGVSEMRINEFSVTKYGKQRDDRNGEVLKYSRPRLNRVRLSTILEGDQ